eukprot:9339239-Pyramimonas_sp.AAC.1
MGRGGGRTGGKEGQAEAIVELHELLGPRGERRVHLHPRPIADLPALRRRHVAQRVRDPHLIGRGRERG